MNMKITTFPKCVNKKNRKKILVLMIIAIVILFTTAIFSVIFALLNINNSKPSTITTDYTTSSTYTQTIEEKTVCRSSNVERTL